MTTFAELNLNPKVLKAVLEAGYETPTPIQEGAIPPALEGRDVLGIAQTGTGKTASFTLPLITMLARGRARARMPRSLVLCPTRELAAQVAENFDIYAKHVKLTKALLIGGVSFKEQDALIDKGVDVLIATPGRLLDHFERGKLILNDVKVMVVDEADRMLDMGFIPDIERIFGLVPFTRQTLFFSATMAPEIERITNTFLSNPEKVEVARHSSTSETIEQRLLQFKPTRRDMTAKQKREMLRTTIESEGAACKNAIIFCNRKVDVDIVAKSLKAHGLNAEPIHGDLDQSHRTRTLDGFRDGSIRFLVASDVAARGLDIPNVSHIFNFDVPSHAEDYVHRIGRTGRAGKTGVAITIAVPSDDKYLGAIEALISQPIPRTALPWEPNAPASDVAPDSDAEKPARKPRRVRTRSKPADTAAEPAAEPTPTPAPAPAPEPTPDVEAEAQPVPEPVAEERPARAARPARTPRPERSERPERAEDPERSERADRGARGSRDRGGRGQGRGDHVVGMGDHLPGFIAMSFDERRGGPARGFDDESDDQTDEMPAEIHDPVSEASLETAAPAEASETPEAKPAPKRRRRKAKPADEAAPAEGATADQPEAAPNDEAASDGKDSTPASDDAQGVA